MAALFIERLLLAAAVAFVLVGAITTTVSGNATKRIAGLFIATLGALLALAALRAPEGALIVAAVAGFAHVAIGAALVTRMQEAYGGVDIAAINAADEQSERPAPEQGA
jgi:hypothetical protein